MKSRLFTFLLLFALTGGCRKTPDLAPGVIVRVGERSVTLDDFKRYLQRNAGTEISQIAPEASSALLDQLVEEMLLAEHSAQLLGEIPAARIAAAVRNDPGSTIVQKRDDLRRDRLLLEISTKAQRPSDSEVAAFYQKNASEFRMDERIRVRQILVRDEKTASEILQKLRDGEPFEKLSTRFSIAANASKGGDIGYIIRGQTPKIFEDEIFKLQPGETSGVIKTDSSFHLFKVDDRQPAGILDLEAAAPVITQRLTDEAMRRDVARAVELAREKFPVLLFKKRLPFAYSGSLPAAPGE